MYSFYYHFFLYPLEIQLSRRGWYPINRLNPATLLCLSHIIAMDV